MSDPRLFRNHAVARVRKRYDMKLNDLDREAITSMVHRKRYVWLRSDHRVNVVAIWYDGKWMPVVVCGPDIVTVLPKEELERHSTTLLLSNFYRELEGMIPIELDPNYIKFKLSPDVSTTLQRYFGVRIKTLNLTLEDNWLKGFRLSFEALAGRINELVGQPDYANLEEAAWLLREFKKE